MMKTERRTSAHAPHVRHPPLVQPNVPDLNSASRTVVNNAEDWVFFFAALCPSGKQKTKVRPTNLRIPQTVLLSTNGCPSVWYYNTNGNVLKSKPSTFVTPKNIQAALVSSQAEGDDILAIARYGFTSRLLNWEELEKTIRSMEKPRLATSDSSDNSTIPFCIQQYIKPKNNLRYITTFSQGEVHVSCDTFTMPYSQRYMRTGSVHSSTAPMPEKVVPLKSPRARAAVKKNEAMEQSFEKKISEKLRHEITIVVNHINKTDKTRQLVGLVCEYIISEKDADAIYLNAVLGTVWKGNPPSWTKLYHVDSESKMIVDYLKQKKVKNETKHAGKSDQDVRQPELPDRIAVFPSVEPPSAAEMRYMSGSSFLPVGDAPRYTNAVVPKLFRNGRFVSQVKHHQAESMCRLHAPVHRSCRSGLVVELTQQLELYKEGLMQHTEQSRAMEKSSQLSLQKFNDSEEKNRTLQQEMKAQKEYAQKSISESTQENLELRRNLEAMKTQAQDQAAENDTLTTQTLSMRDTIDRERETTFGVLTTLHAKIESLTAQLEQCQKEKEILVQQSRSIRESADRDSSRAQATQQEINELRVALKKVSEERDGARKEARDLMTERNALLRTMHLTNGQGDKKQKYLKLNIEELLSSEENVSAEYDIIQLQVHKYQARLKSIFKYYAGAGEVKSSISVAKDYKTMSLNELLKFARDCDIISKDLHIADIDIIFRKTNALPRIDINGRGKQTAQVDQLLYFTEFCEVLIRLSHLKYREFEHVAEKFTHFIDHDVLPKAQSCTTAQGPDGDS